MHYCENNVYDDLNHWMSEAAEADQYYVNSGSQQFYRQMSMSDPTGVEW